MLKTNNSLISRLGLPDPMEKSTLVNMKMN